MHTFAFADKCATIKERTPGENLAKQIIEQYKPKSVADMQNSLKDIFGPMFEAMLQGEMNSHLGYESESKHTWMQIFDELKTRGVEDILFISMDGVSGLEEDAKAIFKDVVVQRCIVHLIRNSIKYVPSKDYKNFT